MKNKSLHALCMLTLSLFFVSCSSLAPTTKLGRFDSTVYSLRDNGKTQSIYVGCFYWHAAAPLPSPAKVTWILSNKSPDIGISAEEFHRIRKDRPYQVVDGAVKEIDLCTLTQIASTQLRSKGRMYLLSINPVILGISYSQPRKDELTTSYGPEDTQLSIRGNLSLVSQNSMGTTVSTLIIFHRWPQNEQDVITEINQFDLPAPTLIENLMSDEQLWHNILKAG